MEISGFSPDMKTIPKVNVNRINLDFKNPRIVKGANFEDEKSLVLYMYKNYALEELALSMAQFGYFDAEPLVCIPNEIPQKLLDLDKNSLASSEEYLSFLNDESTTFTVIEGNRRLSTIKLLLNINGYKDDPIVRKDVFFKDIKNEIKEDLLNVPIIVYPRRNDIVPYLGVKHIGGNKPWDPYAQAVYIDKLIRENNCSFSEIKNLMSDRSGKVIKNWIALKLLDYAEGINLDVVMAINNFSYLILSLGQKSIKGYLGLPTSLEQLEGSNSIITEEYEENFKRFFSWIYGDNKAGKFPVIKESRDITGKLTKILENEVSKKYLEDHWDLSGAFDRCNGERDMIIQGLASASTRISNLRDSVYLQLEKQNIKPGEIRDYILIIKKNIEDLEKYMKDYESR